MQRTPAHPAALDLPPGLTLLGELFAVIADIRQTLDAGTPDAAKLAAIAGYLDERAPPPRMDPDQAAAVIAARLIAADGPATEVFAALLHREITLRVIGPHVRDPDPGERALLRLRAGEQLYVREGFLMAGTVQCAKTTLRLAFGRVARIAGGAGWGRIRAGEPCGTVLAPHGLRRPRRTAEVIPGDARPVRSSAVLYLGALPAGIAAEEVPDSLCAWLAERGR